MNIIIVEGKNSMDGMNGGFRLSWSQINELGDQNEELPEKIKSKDKEKKT